MDKVKVLRAIVSGEDESTVWKKLFKVSVMCSSNRNCIEQEIK